MFLCLFLPLCVCVLLVRFGPTARVWGGKWWWWECTGPIPSPAASIISLYNYKYERVERKVVYVWRNSEWEKASPNSIPKREEVFPSFGDPNHTYVEKRITSARALCSLTSLTDEELITKISHWLPEIPDAAYFIAFTSEQKVKAWEIKNSG